MRRRLVRAVLGIAVVAAWLLTLPLAAAADDDEPDAEPSVRVERACTDGSRIRLRVRGEDDDLLRIVVQVHTARRGARWVVVVVHERRLLLRTTRRTQARSRSFTVRATTPDWSGRDTVVVRALGPRGQLCRVAVTVPDD